MTEPARTATGRRRSRLLTAVLCGAGIVLVGWSWWTHRRFRTAMEEIETEIMAGRYAIACRYLDKLLSQAADPNGKIVYLLGSCELARGRNLAAGEAWARVVPGSVFSAKAIEGRMHLLQESGQLSAAEQLVSDAALDPRNDRTGLLVLLVPMDAELGRVDEAERLIEDRWERLNAWKEGSLESAIKLVLQHIELTLAAPPVETVRASLEQKSSIAPDDDRVWLGRANLAMRAGDLNEAQRWLDACQRHRPEDVPIWRSRLSWGIATNRVDIVKQAMTHLPDWESSPVGLHRINAWLAVHEGDVAAERRELELLVGADPADIAAVDRLAELALKEGQHAQAAELIRKKAEVVRLRARYLTLHHRMQPIRDAAELASLAEQLGRRFEARAFLTVALSEDPGRDDLRRDLARLNEARAISRPIQR
jgi:tetratricopeptide (TPR) repeat protein